MKHIDYFALLMPLLMIIGCGPENPPAIWNPELNLDGSPIIRSIVPDGREFFDDMEITLLGENFGATAAANSVYFNNEKAVILSASPSEIKVRRPRITGDSIIVKVVVDRKIAVARYGPYRIEKLVAELGKFTSSNTLYTLEVDRDENVYAYAQGPIIYKITPGDVKSEFSLPPMTRAIQMRIGPAGYLYIAGTVGKAKGVFRLPPTGGSEMEQIFNSKLNYTTVEFDARGRLYAGGKTAVLVMIDENGAVLNTGRYDRFNVMDMRIVEDQLYVLGIYYGDRKDLAEMGLFKSRLLPDGSVSEETLLLDWSRTGEYASAKLLSFAVAENGDLYLGTSHRDPILILHADGSLTPLYPTLLTSSAAGLVWGNAEYLYMLRGNEGGVFDAARLFRIRLTKTGAPYYGRR